MGLMSSWEKWSLRQWIKWGSKLQSKYDKYRELKTPVWYIEATDDIWGLLSNKTKNFLNRVVWELCQEFDDKYAKDLIDKIVKAVKKKLNL